MGRRSINTTKSGKYMNPTDQARKEARKRELKKNKKQRQMVRAAVLKGKDPTQIILEMDKMDILEFSVENQPTLSEKVLKEKRKKLRETLDRVMKLYEKEDPEYWVEIRRMEAEYDKKRLSRIEYYDAVRHAQAVTVDEIPLPNLDMPSMTETPDQQMPPVLDVPSSLPLTNTHMVPHSILKKVHASSLPVPPTPDLKNGPGCPPSQPPDLSDDDDDDEEITDQPVIDEDEMDMRLRTIRFADTEDAEDKDKDTRLTAKKTKGLTSLQTKLLQMSGQDIDDFMRESEVLFKEKEAEKQADLKARLERLGDDQTPNLQQPPPGVLPSLRAPGPPPGLPPAGLPTGQTLPQVNPTTGSTGSQLASATVEPPPTLNSGPQLPAGPPGVAPTGVLPGVPPPLMLRPPPRPVLPLPPGVRMPPGPPPQGMFPRLPNTRMPPPMPLRPLMRPGGGLVGLPPPGLSMRAPPPGHNPNVLTAGPQLIVRPKDDDKSGSATIEAKAQIRNLSADITRFLPTALRVKREDKKKGGKSAMDTKEVPATKPEETDRRPTKDDAYSQFMKEMEDLL